MKTLLFIISLLAMGSISGYSQPLVEHVKALKKELAVTNSDTARLRVTMDLAREFQVLPPQEVQGYARQAIALAEKLDNKDQEMRARYQLAVAHHLQSDFITSTSILQQIDESGVFAEDYAAASNVKNLLGSGLGELGKYEEALDVYASSLDIIKLGKDSFSEVVVLNNMGSVYADNIDYQKGKVYYLQALELASVLKDTAAIAAIYNNLSETTAQPDSAIYFAQSSLQLFEQIGYLDGIAHASTNMGVHLLQQEAYEKSLRYLRRAKQIWENNQYSPGLSTVYGQLVELFGATGRLDSLQYYLDQTAAVSKAEKSEVDLLKAYETAARYFLESEQPTVALGYFQQASALKDTLFNQEKATQLAHLQSRFEAQEQEKQLIQNQLTIARQQSQQKNILIGGVILLLTLLGVFQYLRNRQRLRQKDAETALQLEIANAKRLRELDRLKSTFFANISHEFRTPLTLIQTPLRQALMNAKNEQVSIPVRYARSMGRNAQRLLHLVNQLLDLAKLEGGGMELHLQEGDLAHFIRSVGYGFESMALRKQINYHVNVTSQKVMGYYDADKLELILSNLLSNAFKFTPPEGRVRLEANFKESEIQLMVKDNGIGISADHLPHIFERFYSISDRSEDMVGSGIGMALTQELVHLYQGHIRLESEINRGTTFYLSLPYQAKSFSEGVLNTRKSGHKQLSSHQVLEVESMSLSSAEEDKPLAGSDKPLLLIVEDNADLRQYTREQLEEEYQVLTAINGKEGLNTALQQIPDLIITDIMMPKMNGYELCTRLRDDERTSHIPIIMLTAKAEREEKLAGLHTGADDYLTKPFDALELKVRTRNLINQRQLLRERFAQEIVVKPREVATTSVDEQFLNKVYEAIENNLEEETFSVVDLAQITALSRSQLNRKLKALVGKSPNHIIRDMRLFRAKELLEKKAGNASEVAFSVGFSSLAYFSKCFKDRFGVSPSEV